MRLEFEIRLTSDYHIGSGHGLGLLDSALMRDGDGVQAIRGSTCEGLLRDGMWRLMQTKALQKARRCRSSGLTGNDPDYCLQEGCPVCAILGNPSLPKPWRISSARPKGLSQHLLKGESWEEGKTGAQSVIRNRISPRQRRAEPHKLFQEEEGDRRLVFAFSAEKPDCSSNSCFEAAWLVAAARMVRRLGSARRRGRGACTLHLVDVAGWHAAKPEEASWQDVLLYYFRDACLEEKKAADIPAAQPGWSKSAATEMPAVAKRLRILVRVDEPIVLSQQPAAGNMFESLDWIPGSAVLGAFAAQAASRWDLSDVNSDVHAAFLRIFRRGDARFSPLYPGYVNHAKQEISAAIPTPFDMLACKVHNRFNPDHRSNDAANPVVGYALNSVPEQCPQCGHGIPMVHPGGFLPLCEGWLGKTQGKPLAVRRREEMHPAMDPRTQRVASGDLFGYVAIEAGQHFVGEIACENDIAWESLRQLTGFDKERPFPLRFGKATRRGYGLVTAWMEELKPDVDPWRGKLTERVPDVQQPIAMTLLTDTILQDAWGGFYQSLEQDWLGEQLGHPVEVLSVFCKCKPIDGFNQHLGLPIRRDLALRAGSAVGFRLKLPQTMSDEQKGKILQRLSSLEREGIGLRCGEGFGQIVFNHPVCHGGSVDSTVELPKPLRLGARGDAQHGAKAIQEESEFLEVWRNDLLDKEKFQPDLFQHEAWHSFARWLWNVAGEPLEQIETGLEKFGNAGLVTQGKRCRKEPFDQQLAMDHIKSWIEQLKGKADGLRRTAIQILADRLVGCCPCEKKRR